MLGLETGKEATMAHSIRDFDFTQLSPTERILLAQQLWESVHEEAVSVGFTAEQRDEIRRRLEQLESGEVQGIPWEQVRQSLLSER